MAALAAIALAVWWQAWVWWQTDLRVVFLNVGQGDCIIIRTPAGRNLLIDGGGRASRSQIPGDIGRWVVVPALYDAGVKKIDCLIATHPHEDHIGGLLEVLDQVPVDMILTNGQTNPIPAYDDLVETARQKEIPIVRAQAGQRFNLGANIEAQVLHPAADLLENTENDLNNNSVVLRLDYEAISFLFPGDLQEEGEAALLEREAPVASLILKAGHHGSLDASSEPFLDEVEASFAVISCGLDNTFGHPHETTLERLRDSGVKILRTDSMGTIEMTTDGEILKIEYGRRGEHEVETYAFDRIALPAGAVAAD